LSRNANSRPRTASGQSKILCRGLVGDSESVRQLRELIRKIAPSRANILITGETGSGKEIVARNIHHHSNQSSGPFVPINCSAIPPELLESELFGHKKARSPVQQRTGMAVLRSPREARYSWTRLATCQRHYRSRCCECWKSVSFTRWVATSQFR